MVIARHHDDPALIVGDRICTYADLFRLSHLPFHAAGATSVVLPGFEPRQMLAVIHTHRPTKLFGFPKIYHELAEAAEASADDLGCLDFCFSAGEAMAVALQQRFRAAFGVEVTEGCGMTELHIYALAGSLSERGIQAGERIAFLLPNGLEVVLCYYACFILGAIAVPLNMRFPPELIAYVLDHSEARILISEPQLFAGIAPIRPERRHLETVYMVGGSPVRGGEYFGDLLRAAGAPESTGVRIRISRLHCFTRRARPAPRRASFTRTAA